METGDAESFCPEILHWIITLFPLFPFKCRQRAGWACTGLWWQEHFYTMTGIFFWNLRGLLFIWLHRYYILELRDNLKEKQAWSSIFHERQLQTVCCLANEHWLLMLEFSGTRIHKQITNSCAINEKNPNKPSTFWVSTLIYVAWSQMTTQEATMYLFIIQTLTSPWFEPKKARWPTLPICLYFPRKRDHRNEGVFEWTAPPLSTEMRTKESLQLLLVLFTACLLFFVSTFSMELASRV